MISQPKTSLKLCAVAEAPTYLTRSETAIKTALTGMGIFALANFRAQDEEEGVENSPWTDLTRITCLGIFAGTWTLLPTVLRVPQFIFGYQMKQKFEGADKKLPLDQKELAYLFSSNLWRLITQSGKEELIQKMSIHQLYHASKQIDLAPFIDKMQLARINTLKEMGTPVNRETIKELIQKELFDDLLILYLEGIKSENPYLLLQNIAKALALNFKARYPKMHTVPDNIEEWDDTYFSFSRNFTLYLDNEKRSALKTAFDHAFRHAPAA